MSSSSSSTSSSFILPDSPPAQERILNYWQQKAALAAKASTAALAPSPLTVEPPSPGEIVLGDSPVQHLAPPATWAPRRVVPTTLTNNNMKQKQWKRRRLVFDEPEVSEDEDETIFSQTKKLAAMENESSLVPLMKEVERAEEDERREMDFVQLINQPAPKPWVPLRELKEDAPYPIISAREHTNKHGRRVILKISNAGSKSVCEVYLPQRFASCISTEKIVEFNKNCKNLVMIVSHKSGNLSDIKIVKNQQFLYLYNSSNYVLQIV
ncbi:uncharacterized protein LOC120354560 [Nilaparvata lugens]|uniref:uncharacterized protein LOC120354560 n=1 Tax=Nilaparvata lugens TaxID=108931 RepID=UPI00193E5B09|nr:uncharacterized protein LOC120354560 [Nilaparvata lugens]